MIFHLMGHITMDKHNVFFCARGTPIIYILENGGIKMEHEKVPSVYLT